jgi:hypothetical protein
MTLTHVIDGESLTHGISVEVAELLILWKSAPLDIGLLILSIRICGIQPHPAVDSKMLRHKDVVLLNVRNMSSYRGPQNVDIYGTESRLF